MTRQITPAQSETKPEITNGPIVKVTKEAIIYISPKTDFTEALKDDANEEITKKIQTTIEELIEAVKKYREGEFPETLKYTSEKMELNNWREVTMKCKIEMCIVVY